MNRLAPRARLRPIIRGGRIIGHGQQLAAAREAAAIDRRLPIVASAPRWWPTYKTDRATGVRTRTNAKPHEAR